VKEPRAVHIFSVTNHSRHKRSRLIAVLQATSLRKGLEQFAKQRNIKDPVISGNTMSGQIAGTGMMKRWEAQEAK
jgi:hypothetical protein